MAQTVRRQSPYPPRRLWRLTDSRLRPPMSRSGRAARIAHSEFRGLFSYCDRYADIANATVGKFANIAAFTRIGATDHPLETAACHHFLYRSADYWDDAENGCGLLRASPRRGGPLSGHDTWLGTWLRWSSPR